MGHPNRAIALYISTIAVAGAACGGAPTPPPATASAAPVEAQPSPSEGARGRGGARDALCDAARKNEEALPEAMRSSVETSCNEGWCRISGECVKREAEVPSCIAQIATRDALFGKLLGGQLGDECQTLRADESSGWQIKLGETQRMAALERRVPCDKKSSSNRCFAIPLRDDERKYCAAATVAFVRNMLEKQLATALDACVKGFAEAPSAPPAPAGCGVSAPAPDDMSKDDYEKKKDACDKECALRAPEARKKYLADAPRRAANAPRCRRCFLAPAREAKGLESWCDSRVTASDYKSLIGPSCDSSCANQKAYDLCVKR